MLTNFSLAQKEYIVKHLYPEIAKALIHFISEAKRHNEIDEPNAFGESPSKLAMQAASKLLSEGGGVETNNMQASSTSAFGGYKMGQSQPSNMQTTSKPSETQQHQQE